MKASKPPTQQWINLTPHTITMHDASGTPRVFPPSGTVARVSSTRELIETRDGIEIFRTHYGDVEGLPGPTPFTTYIVSGMVRQAALWDRHDVVSPGELIRDNHGNPVACKGATV